VAKESTEQDFITREQFRQGIQKKAFPEAARTGEKIRLALPDHAQGKGGFIYVIAVIFPNLAEGLDADGKFLA
jgi:hypothetical protein